MVRLGVRFYLMLAIWVAVISLALMVARPAAAEGYTAEDTVAAIDEASAEIGVSRHADLRTLVR
jgi:hypothetical protein